MIVNCRPSGQSQNFQRLPLCSMLYIDFLKFSENQAKNFQLEPMLSRSFYTAIFHINYWDQVNSWENFWKFWNGPHRNKSASHPLLSVAAYWKSSNTKVCAKKVSQILANNIDNWGRGIGLKIYVRYCGYEPSGYLSAEIN